MGNVRSSYFEENQREPWWNSSLSPHEVESTATEVPLDIERVQHRKELEENMIEFKRELARKHEKRRQLIAEKKKEMMDMREELCRTKQENEELKKRLAEEFYKNRKDDKFDKSKVENEDCFEENGDSEEQSRIKEENDLLKQTVTELKKHMRNGEEIIEKNRELNINIAKLQRELQRLNSEVAQFEDEKQEYKNHVAALKDVIKVSKQLLQIRDNQIEQLSQKINNIEKMLTEKEAEFLSNDLRQDYERQLNNIRSLRVLYEERQRADRREKDILREQIDDIKKDLEEEQKTSSELKERVAQLEEDNSKKYDTILSLESNLGIARAETKEIQAEMDVINQLFSQTLISFNNCQEVDLDKLTKILEENHNLLTDIVINEESGRVSSALPKTLLDLVNRINELEEKKTNLAESKENSRTEEEINNKTETIFNTSEVGNNNVLDEKSVKEYESNEGKREKTNLNSENTTEELESQTSTLHQLNSPEEIVENLPKVWKVLIELLSHQIIPSNIIKADSKDVDNHCYKTIQTPTGSKLVLSVSKTFIRLKDLILEKKALEKETNHLKHLNTHLECRLQDQEKRLEMVSSELSKTWKVVGKMQKQHQQLHTQEKILRYELAQKRKLLTQLKEELEYCREKWVQAREKNSSTEEEWKKLRTEFSSRRNVTDIDINNSTESGYSDEKSSSDSDELDEVDESAKKGVDSDELDEVKNEENRTDGIEKNDRVGKIEEDTADKKRVKFDLAENKNIELDGSEEKVNLIDEAENKAVHDLDGINIAYSLGNNVVNKQTEPSTEAKSSSNIMEEFQSASLSSQNITLISDSFEYKVTPSETSEEVALLPEIVKVVKTEIANIESLINTTVISNEENEEGNFNENLHSDLSTVKTKLVKNDENEKEKVEGNCEGIGEYEERLEESGEEVKIKKDEEVQIKNDVQTENEEDKKIQNTENNKISNFEKKEFQNLENEELQNKKCKEMHNTEDEEVRSEEDKDVRIKEDEKIQIKDNEKNKTEGESSTQRPRRTPEEILAARDERLRRLEEQAKQLVNKVSNTSHRSLQICNKLENLHEIYGESSSTTRNEEHNEEYGDNN